MSTLECIDPSKPGNNTGRARFVCGKLMHAELWTHQRVPDVLPTDNAIIELPQIYPGPRDEDPNDLIQVARCVGQWECELRRAGATVRLVHPREWKGSVPKTVHNARVLAALTDAERARLPKLPASKLHNVLDAVGLGLWLLKRIR